MIESPGLRLRVYVRSFFRRIERILPSYWCEKYIELPPGKQETKAGPVSFTDRPYQRAPLDDVADPTVTDVVFVGPTRIGKTLILRMGVAYSIAGDPAPGLWVDATEPTARRVSKKELQPMIEYNAILRERKPANRHNATDLQILFPAAAFNMVGGNSSAQVAGDTVKRVYGNELDKWSDATDKEASIAELVRHRTESYDVDRKHLWSSTPTIEEGNTWQFYLRGDQRKWFCICQRCRTPQQLVWENVVWDPAAQLPTGRWDLERVKASARYSCINVDCTAHDPAGDKLSGWTEPERTAAIQDAGAHYRPTCAPVVPGWRSYHVNGLYGPAKTNSCGQLAVDFLSARTTGFFSDRQDFWNSRMGMPWRDDISDVTVEKFAERESPPAPLNSYHRGDLPEGFRPDWIIMGCDVQSNRLPYVVKAGDWAGRIFTVDHGDAAIWADLDGVQETYRAKWPGAANYVIVDINYEERRAETLEQIYARRHRGWKAAEAFAHAKNLTRIEFPDVFLGGKKEGQGHTIEKLVISAYTFKVELEKRFAGEIPGWYTYQLPLAATETEAEEQREYYVQLLDERRKPRKHPVIGKPPFEWVSRAKNNHYFDCEVYALALFWVLQKRRAFAARRPPRGGATPRRTIEVGTAHN